MELFSSYRYRLFNGCHSINIIINNNKLHEHINPHLKCYCWFPVKIEGLKGVQMYQVPNKVPFSPYFREPTLWTPARVIGFRVCSSPGNLAFMRFKIPLSPYCLRFLSQIRRQCGAIQTEGTMYPLLRQERILNFAKMFSAAPSLYYSSRTNFQFRKSETV